MRSESEFSTGVEIKDIMPLNRVASGADTKLKQDNRERASRNSNKFRTLIRTMDD